MIFGIHSLSLRTARGNFSMAGLGTKGTTLGMLS